MKLKDYREALGITAQDAARQLGVNPVTLWRWETGRVIPDRDAMKVVRQWSKGTVTANDFYHDEPGAK